MSKKRFSGKGRGGKGRGTWRTSQIFGTVAAAPVGPGNPQAFLIVGNIPQPPVTSGTPEPITEYEVTAVQGGLELGSLNAAPAALAQYPIGFGLYMADIDSVSAFNVLDPLDPDDVCNDTWTHLEWWTAFQEGATVTTLTPTAIVRGGGTVHPIREPFRFSSGVRRLPEGRALVAVISLGATAPGSLNVTPYFRYHIRQVA